MKTNKLQNELFAKGLVERGNLQEIQNFKLQRRKRLTQKYNKEYLKDKKVKSVVFSQKEFEKIEQYAKEYGMPVATFIKACLFAYMDSTFVSPDKEKLDVITHLLSAIRNRVAEGIQYIHLSNTVTYKDFQTLQRQITQVEDFVIQTLENPPRLSEWLKKQIEQDPDFLGQLLQCITDHINLSDGNY